MWVYLDTSTKTEKSWTVGFFRPDDPRFRWVPIKTLKRESHAQMLVSFLNGGSNSVVLADD